MQNAPIEKNMRSAFFEDIASGFVSILKNEIMDIVNTESGEWVALDDVIKNFGETLGVSIQSSCVPFPLQQMILRY
jgi:hypothetical protein